jgi:hypothetical protein
MLQVQDETGTHVHTELQEQVSYSPEATFSSTFTMCISLSGIFSFTDLFTTGVWSEAIGTGLSLSSGGVIDAMG